MGKSRRLNVLVSTILFSSAGLVKLGCELESYIWCFIMIEIPGSHPGVPGWVPAIRICSKSVENHWPSLCCSDQRTFIWFVSGFFFSSSEHRNINGCPMFRWNIPYSVFPLGEFSFKSSLWEIIHFLSRMGVENRFKK